MITPRMEAALRSADADGWIGTPVYNSLRPVTQEFFTADLNRLDDADLVRGRRMRADGIMERQVVR